jgi:BolA protein
MSRAATIERKLSAALTPLRLSVADESARHEGHPGARPGGETHFAVEIVAARFEGLGRVARQRLIHELLAEEFSGGLHALSLQTLTPAEDARRPR